MVRARRDQRRGGHGVELHTFCPVGVTIPQNLPAPYPSTGWAGYACRVEDLSKTEIGVGRLILHESSSETGPWGRLQSWSQAC